jgi:Tol biopolymer transport system component
LICLRESSKIITTMRVRKYFLAFAVGLLAGLSVFSVNAQTQSVDRFSIEFSERITIYRVSDEGNFEVLATLPEQFNLPRFNTAWQIPSVSYIAPSPDGQSIALIASDNLNPEQFALFIYSVTQENFRHIMVEGIGVVKWSPFSDALLISPPEDYIGNYGILRDIYILNMNSGVMSNLTNSPEQRFETDVMWLPDNRSIAFVGASTPFDANKTQVRNIFVLDNSRSLPVPLTNLQHELPYHTSPYYVCDTINLTWSSRGSRIYYVVRCDADGDPHDLLYSVSLNGDNRLEADFLELYPDDRYTLIKSIDQAAINDDIYVTIDSESLPVEDEIVWRSHFWRVVRIIEPQQTEVVYDVELPVTQLLTDTAVSPDDAFISLSGFDATERSTGYIVIVNLVTEQIVLEREVSHGVCDVEWMDDSRLIYAESESYGSCFYLYRTGIWVLNITNNTTAALTNTITGTMPKSLIVNR